MLNRLAGASLALGAGAGTGGAAFSPQILGDWVDAELADESEASPSDTIESAERAATRASAAVAALWPQAKERVEHLVKKLAGGESATARIGAAAALGRILEIASPVERIEIVCRWTVSPEVRERTAIARALGLPTPVFVADLALTELARDESAEVRAASAGAILRHFHENPEAYGRAAEDLLKDSDPMVRRAASERLPIG
jgi:hypothetical protein